MTTPETFGQWLYRQRKMRGWTQQMVADRVGLSKSRISALERGIANNEVRPDTLPERENAERIADAFGISRLEALQVAGYAPRTPPNEPEWVALYNDPDLTADDRAEIDEIVRAVWRIRKAKRLQQ